MNRRELQEALSKGAEQAWKTSLLRDSQGDIVLWVPLAALDPHGSSIGLSADGYWVISASENTVVKLDEGKPPVFLLPALERPHSEIVQLIKTALENYELPQELIAWFPVEDIIVFGLTVGMDYWADLALKWLDLIPVNARIANALSTTTDAKWASQSVRQRAQRLAREFTRKSTD